MYYVFMHICHSALKNAKVAKCKGQDLKNFDALNGRAIRTRPEEPFAM